MSELTPLQDGRETPGVEDDQGGGEPLERPEELRPEVRGAIGPLIDALHDIFERDRAVASQGTSTRCGICYLHYPLADLTYREAEGFYVCAGCAQAMGSTQLFMVRRQQR
jgi:hypothetical protein